MLVRLRSIKVQDGVKKVHKADNRYLFGFYTQIIQKHV